MTPQILADPKAMGIQIERLSKTFPVGEEKIMKAEPVAGTALPS